MAQGDELDRRIAALAADRERGATELAREALDILRWAAEQGLLSRMREAAVALAASRPAMAAVKNTVARVIADPAALANTYTALDACRHAREWLDYASQVTVEHADRTLPNAAVLVTCSYSTAVIRTSALAASDRRLRVLALESRVGGASYGERLAAQLREAGVACEVVPDERMGEAVRKATLVLVGTDRVLPDGALSNGTPSLALARAARGALPFYAICEAFKLDVEPSVEPGFDLVPSDLVAAYVTEKGVVSPGEVWAVHRRA